ncbi:MAG TPA: UvrD-helicase domain-containing protein [Rhodocyclaceae bacterium]|nr:UvrD-helicase domain-containing protein [Rhodocyclaceae bacterium]
MSAKLNPAQREAIRYLDGPLLVLAGAGSGKTRVITQKIAYLIEECGIAANGIYAITFTNKAAKEMQERVAKLLEHSSANTKGITVSTFHSLGVRILREEARLLGYKPGFSIFDSDDCYAVISDLSKSVDKKTIRQLQWTISGWKNAGVSEDFAAANAANETEKLAALVYRDYAATMKAYQAVDFDDLIRLPLQLFEEHAACREKWQNRVRYLLVDEYQDTNGVQYQLVRHLTGPRAQFTAVGDDDQAIYGWRGADIENLKKLTVDYPALKVVMLEQNYRSSTRILQAANAVIGNNPKLFDKKLWSEHGPGDPISVINCKDNEHEAEAVTMRLQAHKFERRAKWSDYAILYRSNHQARIIEKQLRDHKIPYQLSGGQSFFDKAEIRDVTSYLRLLANQDDDPAFIRAATTPRRGIGQGTLEALGNYAGERHISLFAAVFEQGFQHRVQARQLEPLTEFCEFINRMEWRAKSEPAAQVLPDLMAAIGYEAWVHDQHEARAADQKMGNVNEFVDWLAKKGEADNKTLLEMTQLVALINMLDKKNGDGSEIDAVQLSTLHAAKGLEFGHVFLIGVEEGLLPHRESSEGEKIEEERRLMYVGITRAQRSLHLTWCAKRKQGMQDKAGVPVEPSRFIAEMGAEVNRPSSEPLAKEAAKDKFAAMKAMLNKDKG